MASDATNFRLGHVARFLHFHRAILMQAAFLLVTEIALSVLGAPVLAHLAVGAILHCLTAWARARQ